MLRRILIGFGVLFALCVAGAIVVFVGYSGWHAEHVARLEGESQLAATAKGPLEYAISGDGPRTILFVHGTPGGYDQGARFAETGRKQGFRVLRVSRPGYLRTPLETGASPAEQADAYAALLDTLGIAKVSIIGVSGGGPSSAQFAARHPERCEALVMMSAISKPRERGPEHRPNMIEAFLRGTDFGGWLLWRNTHRNPEGAVKRTVSDAANQQRILASPDKRAAYLTLADSALVLPSRRVFGLLNDRRWFVEMPDIPLASIRVPTLAVHGDADTSVSFENAQAVATHVPGAVLVAIAGGGHLISITHGEEAFTPVFDLLERLGKAAEPAPPAIAAEQVQPEPL